MRLIGAFLLDVALAAMLFSLAALIVAAAVRIAGGALG